MTTALAEDARKRLRDQDERRNTAGAAGDHFHADYLAANQSEFSDRLIIF